MTAPTYTHRTQAKAKRSQRTHHVMTYGLLDTLFASPDAPMPAEKRRHQLTRMYGGLRAMETAPAPTRDDWRVVSDAVNLMEINHETSPIPIPRQ